MSVLHGGAAPGPVLVERFGGGVAGSSSRADRMARSDLRFRAYRSGPFALVLDSGGRAALFDVRKDPEERNDIFGLRPDDHRRLERDLDAWRAAIGLPHLDGAIVSAPAPAMDDETQERLRALGCPRAG